MQFAGKLAPRVRFRRFAILPHLHGYNYGFNTLIKVTAIVELIKIYFIILYLQVKDINNVFFCFFFSEGIS